MVQMIKYFQSKGISTFLQFKFNVLKQTSKYNVLYSLILFLIKLRIFPGGTLEC